MARRASPSPPKRLSDAQLEKARPHEVERHLAEHEAYAERLERAADPGKGRPTPEADRARERHLAQIKKQTDEVVRLAAALPPEPDPTRQPGVLQKLRRIERRMIAKAHEGEPQEFLDGLHENMRERQKQRDAKKGIAELAEKRRHPAQPQAESIVAAVMADASLYDGVRRRLRPVSEGEGQRAFRAYDYEDLGLLCVVLHVLREHGRVEVKNISSSAVFADPELPQIPRLGQTLAHLRKNGWLVATFEGSTGFYTYGPRVRKIAEKWGLDLPAAVVEEPEAVVTRS